MKTVIPLIIIILALSSASASADSPCKASSQTTRLLDDILTASTVAEIKADQAVRKEAFHNVVDILNSDECVNFLLKKGKTKKLAATILSEKQASAKKKSAAIIGGFLSNL